MNDLEQRLRNKIAAAERQANAFKARLDAFRQATLWERLVMAWRGEV